MTARSTTSAAPHVGRRSVGRPGRESPVNLRLAVVQLIRIPGGSQNFWAHALTDPIFADVEKHVVIPARGTIKFSDAELSAFGIRMHRYYGPVARVVLGALQHLGSTRDSIVRALESIDPDIVWFNLGAMDELTGATNAAAYCRAKGIPYWVIVQCIWPGFCFANDAKEAQARVIARAAARILTVSARNRKSIAIAFAENMPNIECATNGVTRPFLDAAELIAANHPPRIDGTARFLSPARFDPTGKGQHILLEILSDAVWATRDWHLSLVGGGKNADLIKRLVGFFGIPTDRVTITGYTADMLGVFTAADVITMPSLCEGSPFALAEGIACGRPAVGTPAGGIEEIVREGETGWLAPSAELNDVADAMDRCWRDRPQWPRLGRGARILAEVAYDLAIAHPALLAKLHADARRRGRRRATRT